MLLAIDLGNTNLTIGLFKNEDLIENWRLSSDTQRTKDEYGLQIIGLLENSSQSPEHLTGIVLSSVVPQISDWLVQACEDYLHLQPLIVAADLKLQIKILYENPFEVGADRIADAEAVWQLYGGPACVIDFGTATTFNAITEKGEYLGGAILPGLETALEALVRRTSKLPPVALVSPPSVIGRNTKHAMQSGLIYGYVSLVEGMINRFRNELGKSLKVIATGGLVNTIASHTDSIDIVDQWLTLKGLRLIWESNQ